MKKTLFVVALAAVLVVAVASSAFAASGQDRQGAAAVAPAPVANGPYAGTTVAGAGTYTYMNWNSTLGTNLGDNSPHGNYTTTTVKCVVCHAVHYAAPGTAPVSTGNQAADTLLRMKASDACVYCHATADVAVNGVPVYQDGIDDGHVIGDNCDECHTGVHAAGADNSVASLRGYLLKTFSLGDVQGQGSTASMYDVASKIDAQAVAQGWNSGDALGYTADELSGVNTSDARTHAVGIFCAQCHFGSYAQLAAGASTNVNGSTSTEFSGHRVGETVVGSDQWNADGSVSSSALANTKVAWAPATTCASCHDATYAASGDTAFPHGWGGAKMWLTSADDAASAKTDVTVANGFDATVPQLSDGICLKCHVGDANNGVGITF